MKYFMVALSFLTFGILIYARESKDDTLQVLFPIAYLKNDSRVVDVTNLKTIYEYYLVESLGAGLLRDTPSTHDGYTPLLAESWHQNKPNEWQFRIKSNLTWSNGEPLTGEQIANHFATIKNRESKHLLALRRLEQVSFEPIGRILTMVFNGSTNSSLLHELSLADAVVTYPGQSGENWSVTSGAYSVGRYDPKALELELRINPTSVTANDKAPKSIHLFFPKDKSLLVGAFKDYPVDLYYQPAQPYRNVVKTIRKQAPQIYSGHPNTISFFSFNSKHPLAHHETARQAFRKIVTDALKDFPWDETIQPEEQMIPPGYAGRISHYESQASAGDGLAGQTILIVVSHGFRELPQSINRLKVLAKSYGVILEIAYSDEVVDESKIFATLKSFKGNQVDPAGSWNFLFNGDDAELGQFRGNVLSLLNAVTVLNEPHLRNEALDTLHRQVLEHAYAVPVMLESNAILASNRVTLNNINPFDLRLRFYDVVWK
jgi:ABC-type oligopeptide transport system substrate-binding subunit